MTRSKSGGVHVREPAKGTKLVRGRRSGVEGSYGNPRGGRRVNAERTAIYNNAGGSGAGDGDKGEKMLGGTARNLYLKALGNAKKTKRDPMGDGALWER